MNFIEKLSIYAEDPNKVAQIYRESVMTYKELNEKSDALACYIIKKYGEDKTPILVYGHKQHEMIISFLACVKAGHPYIPIDSSLPQERLIDIIESSRVKMILSVGNLSVKFPDLNVKTISEINKVFLQYRDQIPNPSFRVSKDDTYYIIYTSGSTGKPKGVQITLGCLESFIKWGLKLSKPKEKDIFMNQAPFSFDLSVMDLYLSLASGSTLFSIDKDMISNLKELFEYLKGSNITTWVSTPSFAEMCLADSSFNFQLLPNMKLFLFCGETLTNSCVSKLNDRFKDIKIINTYGPTEATVAVTSVIVNEELNKNNIPLPVGKVKEDCKIFILNNEGKMVADGEKGEIVIVGDSVSVGYYNNKEMTERSFFKMLIDGIEYRAYKTGDEGYIKDDMLHYCGRIDFQVKVNGFRIELEDIENNLRKIELIKSAVVIPVMKERKIQYLAGVVTLARQVEEKDFKTIMCIKNELKKFLPDYMIPRKIVIKKEIPITPNGKVNRKLLMEEMQ
ncbi:D-alanine--poly(phosphoribitol) ligase subunit 1 [Clostridium botulinum]|uniref:D-alanine--D-alanyl carrier protein ligase n=1 Tax=Clostridium botulinum TaxID=1491 RepID=A0ABC8CYH5_CLOBO|nr:D-alanine--poly(phosphoribitol) ligase subunit 1 [Clostridium botulinum]